MRIAFVNQPFDEVYTHGRNSIAIWSYNAAKHLSLRHSVSIFCRHFGEDEPVEKEGITFHGIDHIWDDREARHFSVPKSIYKNRKPLFASNLYYRHYFSSIAREIAKEGIDIVHIHNFPQVVNQVRRRNPKAIIVLHLHCDWLIQIHRPWIEKMMKHVTMVIGCSDYITEGIKEAFPKYAGKCRRLYNGFDANKFYSKPREKTPAAAKTPYLLYVGRGSPEKGLHLATRAFAQIAGDYPELNLLCVGPINPAPRSFLYDLVDEETRRYMEPCYETPYRDYIYDDIPENIRKRIIEIPHVKYEKMCGVYQNATMLVVPSVCQEAFGMPALEAIACGTPIVASRSGGIPDFVVEGKDGIFAERGSLPSLVSQLRSMLETPVGLRSEEERIENLRAFSWQNILLELEAHYESLTRREVS